MAAVFGGMGTEPISPDTVAVKIFRIDAELRPAEFRGAWFTMRHEPCDLAHNQLRPPVWILLPAILEYG
jgi:hypothetical protein